MKKLAVEKVIEIVTGEVMENIKDRILTIDPDSVDAIVQKALDEIETQVYEQILGKINVELANHHDHMDKWW